MTNPIYTWPQEITGILELVFVTFLSTLDMETSIFYPDKGDDHDHKVVWPDFCLCHLLHRKKEGIDNWASFKIGFLEVLGFYGITLEELSQGFLEIHGGEKEAHIGGGFCRSLREEEWVNFCLRLDELFPVLRLLQERKGL